MFVHTIVFADLWSVPEPRTYYSPDEKYYFKVIPRKDWCDFLPNPFADWCGTFYDPFIPGKGTLYKLGAGGKYRKVWSVRLPNEVAPTVALVSDSGNYVVTFDEWFKAGYGKNVVVIYGPKGRRIKRFALEDLLSEDEIRQIPSTVSSRWWGSDHYLDEENNSLVLKITRNWKLPQAEGADSKEVRIDLRTGELIKN